jgi:hypothetical protein
MRLNGETFLRGEVKMRVVDAFSKSLKAAPEFKTYTPPFGGIDSTTEEGARSSAPGDIGVKARKSSGFSVMCTYKRK